MGFADQMRAPSGVCLSWMAMKVMASGGGKDSVDCVEKFLDLKEGMVVVEYGPGAGFATKAILSKGAKKLDAFEISPAFRAKLARDPVCSAAVAAGTLAIHGKDAYSLPFIAPDSVDRLLGINVVYFLDPLDVYLKEIARILKPGGVVVMAVKPATMLAKIDPKATVYKNQDYAAIVKAMEAAGFEASVGEPNLEGGLTYLPIIGKKTTPSIAASMGCSTTAR